MDYTKEELFELRTSLTKSLDDVNNKISKLELTFVEWLDYGEKTDYTYINSLPKDIHDYFIDSIEGKRMETFTLEFFEDELYGVTDPEEGTLPYMLWKANFGSVTWDW